MGSDIKDYAEIKGKLEAAQKQKDEAEGGLKQVMSQLKDLGCPTLAAAKKRLAIQKKELEKAEQKRDEAFKTFEEKWPDELEED